MFQFSNRSVLRLQGVKDDLVDVAMRAIEISDVDFGIQQGLRSVEEQKRLVRIGASQTMQSKHLTGDAIDIIVYHNGKYVWTPVSLYISVAQAFQDAAREFDERIRWGAAWHIEDFGKFSGNAQSATDGYVALRRREGKKPFLDYGHMELN